MASKGHHEKGYHDFSCCLKYLNSLYGKLKNIKNKVAITALFLSASSIFWPYISRTVIPPLVVDIKFPQEIQFMCTYLAENESTCDKYSNVKLVADLFSIWNKYILSTKPEILNEIYAVAFSDKNSGKQMFRWKYFTEILDNKEEKVNTNRILLRSDIPKNIEVEFYHSGQLQGPESDSNAILYNENKNHVRIISM